MSGTCSIHGGESVFVGKAEGRRSLRRPWLRWEKILKWILKK
jgi:hypothetical protein